MLASRARTVSVKAQAKQQAKPAKASVARAVAAVVTSVALLAAPVIAAEVNDDTVRPAVCAANPTAKICLRGSFARSQQ
ncbi:hypothetical protein Rsub_02879 [Raphidocelis subcapitata]|uniref:Uncharacterized protein n=1 Tax=Raphidocelis subcapitata TaxID=307507 RepID=A0A2V0NQX8_9CHLO|nr:hypothetical protein Rsub_02879 [Raphidocelis subcapitata]|eukprot:GBF89709.1 hypothetical protein Rsub_02879 [Raphidocelis subcapitata]